MPSPETRGITRSDHRAASDPGIEIALREVRPERPAAPRPILLIHGGGGGGVASFDVPVPGYSLAEEIARMGRIAVTVDLRGWGDSTRPAALHQPPDANPPAISSEEAARDIAAAIAWARDQFGSETVDLLGWATGGHWAAMAASRTPELVDSLISLNALHHVDAPWDMRAAFADPQHPDQFTPEIGSYALRTAESLLGGWNRSIPIENKDAWRDPAVAEAYARATIESDPTSNRRTPPSVRTPTGFQRDSFEQSLGKRFWEAERITARVLIVRGTLDYWSRPEDVTTLERDLTNARSVETLLIENGTHFVFLDLPERGRDTLLEALRRFLAVQLG